MDKKNYTQSLYIRLGIIVVIIVSFIMSIFLTLNYYNTKSKLLNESNKNSQITLTRLKNSIAPFIESYAINEYEKLLLNEMENKTIQAIIVKDYFTGNILGKKSFYTGKIRDKEWNILHYDPDNLQQKKFLESAYLISQATIANVTGTQLGRLEIYFTDKFMQEELNSLIEKSIIITAIVSLLLILLLYISIKKHMLSPIEKIIKGITQRDEEGLPLTLITTNSSKEIEQLSHAINEMIRTIKGSRNKIDIQQHELEETNIELQKSLDLLSLLNKEFEAEKRKYQQLMNLSSDMIFVMDDKGNLVEYSKRVADNLGYSDEELKKLTVYDIDRTLTKNEFEQIINNIEDNEAVTLDRIHYKKDHSTYIANVNTVKIKIDDKKYIYSSARDITEEKQYQEKLKAQKEEFESIFNYSKDGIAIIDKNSNFLQFNDAYLKLTGYTRDELLTKSCLELTTPENKTDSEKALQTAIEFGYIENFEITCISKEGKRFEVNMTISMFPDKERLLLVSKDVTSLKLLEEQSKLASMGEMIGNIAHQWRQPLNVITTSATGLEMKAYLGKDITNEDISKFTKLIYKQANYLSKTIDDFRNFIRGDVKYLSLNIKEALEETIILSDAALKGNYIKLICNIEDDLIILGNKNELEQAFINILNNAKDILKEKNELDDKYVFLSTKKLDENTLEIKFLDNGGGIDEKVVSRIFEPYFTTKHKSQGTGLGLSMVDKIIRQRHKGSIKVHNEEFEYEGKTYKGACFVVTFHSEN